MTSAAYRKTEMPLMPSREKPLKCSTSAGGSLYTRPVRGMRTMYHSAPALSSHGFTSSFCSGMSSTGSSVTESRTM